MVRFVAALVWLICAGCGGGGGGGSTPVPQSSPPPTMPFGLDERTPLAPLNLPAPGSGAGTYDTVDAFPSLSFAAPLLFAVANTANSSEAPPPKLATRSRASGVQAALR